MATVWLMIISACVNDEPEHPVLGLVAGIVGFPFYLAFSMSVIYWALYGRAALNELVCPWFIATFGGRCG